MTSHSPASSPELPKPAEWALQLAAQAWCEPTTSSKVMDAELATVFAQQLTRLAASFEADRAGSAAAAQVVPEKIAPVQGYTPGIPWSLHLEAYDAYSKKWSPQPALIDLEGRNCRGGFSVGELDGFIPGWREKVSEIGRLRAKVRELEAALPAAPTGDQA